jgi:hypothetical protein
MLATPKKRVCSNEKDFNPLANKPKQICLPIDKDAYTQMIAEPALFRSGLDELISEFPELFPQHIVSGYTLHDILPPSKKMPGIRLRRIKLRAEQEVFTIRPSFVMPYMTGYTDDVEKALFLRKWAVPYAALAYVFGRDENYWYRLENRFGRNSIVGTTVKVADKLPQDLLADEKHTRFNGEKAYLATTVGHDCVLGVSIALGADEDSLTEAYGHFKTEAQDVSPVYTPDTVNSDGWLATHLAWLNLFPLITVILCFLHAFINIRSRCKRLKEHYHTIKCKVWDTYHALDAQAFMEKLAELETWAKASLPEGTGLNAILKLCTKAPQFLVAYEHPSAYRTSNMVDRHMDAMARYLDSCKYYHGHLMSAEYSVRSWALLHNYWPYCSRAKVADEFQSPAHKLNVSVYHDNWLHNLLIAASMGGYRQ